MINTCPPILALDWLAKAGLIQVDRKQWRAPLTTLRKLKVGIDE